jgi:hypothetical protein
VLKKLNVYNINDMDLENPRVKACFDCHEYCVISVDDYKAIEKLKLFEGRHRGHRTQVVNLNEIQSNSSGASIYRQV